MSNVDRGGTEWPPPTSVRVPFFVQVAGSKKPERNNANVAHKNM